VTCNCSGRKHQSAAAGRVFRLQGSSFQEKMPLGTPKKRVRSKKSFHLSSKKSGARVTCNCSGRKHQSAAAGRVFRLQGSSFQEKMPLGTPKKRVRSKKSFHLSSKKSGARVTCNCSGRKHQSAAAGRVFRLQGSSFQEKMPLGTPKKRVKSKKSLRV
jgi:hypothetical protein